MYKDSTVKEHWYFFAIAGLNITQKILNTLTNETKIDDALLEHWDLLVGNDVKEFTYERDKSNPNQNQLVQEEFFQKENPLWPIFNHMYFIVFKLFNQSWVHQKASIMQFTQFLNVIYEE